jgi:hypothetical protein
MHFRTKVQFNCVTAQSKDISLPPPKELCLHFPMSFSASMHCSCQHSMCLVFRTVSHFCTHQSLSSTDSCSFIHCFHSLLVLGVRFLSRLRMYLAAIDVLSHDRFHIIVKCMSVQTDRQRPLPFIFRSLSLHPS